MDEDNSNERLCHGKWSYTVESENVLPEITVSNSKLYLTGPNTMVLAEENKIPTITMNKFGEGKGIYLASYRHSMENAGKLLKLILDITETEPVYSTNSFVAECTYYPESGTIIIINNSETEQEVEVRTPERTIKQKLMPFDTVILNA